MGGPEISRRASAAGRMRREDFVLGTPARMLTTPHGRSMLSRLNPLARLPSGQPLLMVVVDTEEEFDWSAPFDRASRSVRAMEALPLAQDMLHDFGVVPTYVIDHPVATAPASVAVLRHYQDLGQCLIGSHLHPWVTPPDEEEVTPLHSYPGNLEPALERAKLSQLTAAIADAFGTRPVIYKAGRYGVGPATAGILADLGYLIDLSVVPHSSYDADGGPDFRQCLDRPYWFGDNDRLLEIPLSCGFSGYGARFGPDVYHAVNTPLGRRFRLGAMLSRTGLLTRAMLTPEGVDSDGQRQLIKALRRRGHRIFTLNYHSPSLALGCTPYVQTARERRALLDNIRWFLDYFLGPFGGRTTTPIEVRAMAMAGRPAVEGPRVHISTTT